ncbi:MAG: hypothetical protein ACD_18C00309G0002 [uncultured bacterium]|nr:MAG: hypothetical protein ACD_18C00309G0002 [uncultured bacterium]
MNFEETSSFQKDVKKLSKKYKTLEGDIEEFKRVVKVAPFGNNNHFAVLSNNKNVHIIKARFFCRALKGKHLRIVYAYHEDGEISFLGIRFIELFFKGDKEREDQEKIKEYLNSI